MNEYALDILRLAGQGYCCSQILLLMALELQDKRNPGLIRALQGLCDGFPRGKGVCGAATGAACLISYYAGKGGDRQADKNLPLMLDQFAEWFEEQCSPRFSGISCRDITGDAQPDKVICGELIGQSYANAMGLLIENGFRPEEYDE